MCFEFILRSVQQTEFQVSCKPVKTKTWMKMSDLSMYDIFVLFLVTKYIGKVTTKAYARIYIINESRQEYIGNYSSSYTKWY